MTLLAAFQILLHRYSGQDDILVGSPVATRSWAATAGLVGYFVNPLVLRADASANPTFEEFLNQVRQTVLTAFEHQDYPFSLLVERLQPGRNASWAPLFQVMFVLHKAHLLNAEGVSSFALGEAGARMRLGDLLLESISLEQRIAQFDLTLLVTENEEEGNIGASLQYNTDLFEAETIHRLVGHFRMLLTSIVAAPHERLSDLQLLTGEDRHQLLVEWKDTHRVYDPRCLHEMFEEQVRRTPERVAVVAQEAELSYGEVERRANQMAQYLVGLGVGPEVRVGILLERSAAMVVALLGVLKAGGSYVPLDPAYPAQRLGFMLEDSGAALLVTEEGLMGHPAVSGSAGVGTTVVCLERAGPQIAACPERAPASGVRAENLAYVIYTSGSTGRPKGVAIEHHSASAFTRWVTENFAPEDLAGIAALTSISFDLSILELFVPLSNGGRVILLENALALVHLREMQKITFVNTVPSVLAEVLRLGALPASVRVISLAGEPLRAKLVQQIYQESPQVERVYNFYGPTEDTVYSTWSLVPRGSDASPTIGRPVAKTQAYILDLQLNPLPIGITGELYLGGEGLARGYLRCPELTAENFIPNPHGAAGTRLYRTGDLARYLPNGEIELLGRIDHQVKV